MVALTAASLSLPAQPTVLWNSYLGYSASSEGAGQSLRLSADRFVSVGGWRPAIPSTIYYPLLAFSRANGDSIQMVRVGALPNVSFRAAAAAENGDFYAVGQSTYDSTGTVISPSAVICRFDSLGALRWQRYYTFLGLGDGTCVVALPDGAIFASGGSGFAEVRRVDGVGRTKWVRQYGNDTNPEYLTPLADGSYALLTADPNRLPPPHTVYSYDAWVLKITPTGDTVRAAYVGDNHTYEIASRLIATADGGLALVGLQASAPGSQPRRGILFKLDSAWNEQWRYSYAPAMGRFEEGGDLHEVKELANGHFLVSGLERIRGIVAEIAAPGTALWTWEPPQSPGATGWPKIDQFITDDGRWRGYGYGASAPGHTRSDIWLGELTNLPPPAPAPDPCATPPGPPAASFQPAGGPATLRFALDVAATPAGPRYADISRVTWDFGDGSAPDTGRTVLHTFAAPTPVRVRCTITNNRFCHRSADLFPFGPLPGVGLPEAAPLPAVHLWPNPSATGRFEVRLADGDAAQPSARPAYLVLDATGRTLLAGTLRGPAPTLDLRHHPAGVYALRLRWPDGRTLSRRIVRW